MKTVLIVEDDRWLQELESKLIHNAGFKVETCQNASDAINIIDKEIPDVVVLDIMLEGVTGFALLHELQTYNDTQKLPIIICTNLADQLDNKEMTAYGVYRVIDKSTMNPDDLVNTLKSLFDR